MNEIERRALLGVAGVGAIAALAKAGPLNPPAGAVAPTGRTTDEIYNKIPAGGSGDGRTAIPSQSGPVTINQPGSYVLTGNIAGNGGNGITIAADHVTLDLNGFAVASGFNNGNGVQINSGLKGITVRNGLISGFTYGVLVSGSPTDVLLEDLFIKDVRWIGIISNNINARNLIIRRCTVADAGAGSVAADLSSAIAGIYTFCHGVVVQDCTVSRLLYNGAGTPTFRGMWITNGSNQVVSGCTVIGDTATIVGVGISVAATAVRRNNTVLGFTSAYGGGIDGGGNV